MATFSWNTGTYGGSAFVTTAGYGWYNSPNESFPSARLAANGKRPIVVSKVEFLGGGSGGKSARFKIGSGSEKTSGLVADPDEFRFVVRATAGGTTTFLRNTGASGTIVATDTADSLAGQLPGRITYSQVPTAPSISSLTQASLTEAQVSWSAPSDDGDSAITGYRVDWSTSSTFASGVNTSYPGTSRTTKLTGIAPGSTIYVRVAAINAVASAAGTTSVFSSTSSLIMAAAVGDVDGWSSFGTDPTGIMPLVTGGIRRGTVTPLGAGTTGLIREYTRTGSGSTSAGVRGIQRTFTDLTVGVTYRIVGKAISMSDTTPSVNQYRWAVVSIGSGDWGTISNTSTPADVPTYEFEATSTSHTVQLQANAAAWSGSGYFENFALYGVRLLMVPNPTNFFCQDVALETSLANHYTVACATVGAAWWVGADNVTRFRQADDTPSIVATFSDVNEAGTIPYIDVAVAQSTKNIANILTITNHGRDPISGDTSDLTTQFTDDDSVAAWGPREARMSLSLYDGPTYLPDRAAEVLARMGVPHRTITSVTFNAQQDLSIVPLLEIQARVAVTFEGVTDVLRVVGVQHRMSAGEWLITLYLSVWGYPEATSSGIGMSTLTSGGGSADDPGFKFVERVYVTSSGTFTKASYPWLRAIDVTCVGAGGAGYGAAATSSGQVSGGPGGDSGGVSRSFITDVGGLDASVTLTIGAGGTGVSGGTGNNGGQTSFGSLVIAPGGDGSSGRSADTPPTEWARGGTRTAGTGDFAAPAAVAGPYLAISTTVQSTSAGASLPPYGSGGTRGNNANGAAGAGYGAGGGGTHNAPSQSARTGGAGAPGLIILELFA